MMEWQTVKLGEGMWDRIAAASPAATFFHTRCWVEIITKTFPFLENATIAWRSRDGRNAILPLVKTRVGRSGTFRRLHGMWPGVYGSILCDGQVSESELDLLYQSVRSPRIAGGYIFGNPFADHEPRHTWKTEQVTTQMVDLRAGPDGIWRNMESAFRRRVRRGRENGVAVATADSLRDYQQYYEVYSDAQQRWGDRTTSSYPFALFENIHNAAAENPDSIRLWLARVEGAVGAGVVVFYHRDHAVSWHAATLEALFSASPANVLQMGIIEDACRRGFRWYDLNPSGGHAGAARFKQGMGAAEQAFTKATLRPSFLWEVCRRAGFVRLRGRSRSG